MEQLATDFKSIENSIARYIFKKYIMPKPNNQPEPISTNQLSNRDSNRDCDGDNASDMDDDGDSDNGSDVKDVILDETNIGVSKKFDNKL